VRAGAEIGLWCGAGYLLQVRSWPVGVSQQDSTARAARLGASRDHVKSTAAAHGRGDGHAVWGVHAVLLSRGASHSVPSVCSFAATCRCHPSQSAGLLMTDASRASFLATFTVSVPLGMRLAHSQPPVHALVRWTAELATMCTACQAVL